MKYIPTIGLEIHVELNTQSKMFCSCKNDSLERHPNINVCPICMGHPGTLPAINEEAVKKVIKVGLALNSKIPEHSKFDRKNYFYPDLPKGYQISQYDMPLCVGGFLDLSQDRQVKIRRVHLEEDTGRLLHPEGAEYSLVDFNRAGVPLMELVTEPDIHSAREAREFAEGLQLIFRYLGVSDADMEKGQMRAEVNISLLPATDSRGLETDSHRYTDKELGVKVEIKNLNSFRSVEKAIEYEIMRQTKILDGGEKVVQETRGWHDAKQITFSQRSKEEAHDYRYFPEPDLPPLEFSKEDINKIKAEIPELPRHRRDRFVEEYKLGPSEVEMFVTQKDLGEYYEKVMSELRQWRMESGKKGAVSEKEFEKLARLASNYIQSDLQGLLKGAAITDESFLITPENFAELMVLVYEKKISSKIAKQVLAEMFAAGADPSHIIEEKGLSQVEDEQEIEKIAKEVISQNPKAVEDYKKGKQNALQFLVGQVMAETRGRAEPEKARKALTKLI